MVGNFVTRKLKRPGPRFIWIPIVLRTLFVPLLMFCNYAPHSRNTPIMITTGSDAVHGIVSAFIGFTNGYFITLLMEYLAAKCIAMNLDVGLAMKFGTVMILSGVSSGVLFSLALGKLASIKS